MNQNSLLKEELLSLADLDYQKFTSNLLPGINNILGVRLPSLRSIAKRLAKGDWQNYLDHALDDTFEEIMLQGLTIGYVRAEFDYLLPYMTVFIDKINNWSTCDSFCNSLKLTKNYQVEMWNFLLPYTKDSREYPIRFGVVMLINYYIDDEHIKEVLSILDSIKHPGYYVKMAVAWAISMCYVHYPHITMDYLNNNTLDKDTYNKALQKIIESLKVDPTTKTIIRNMKR